MKAWLVPISMQNPKGHHIAHFMEHSTDTHRLVPTACGRAVNPGFASLPSKGTKHCKICQRKMNER